MGRDAVLEKELASPVETSVAKMPVVATSVNFMVMIDDMLVFDVFTIYEENAENYIS
jgi:hypothetical protein